MLFEEQEPQGSNDLEENVEERETINSYDNDIKATIVNQGPDASIKYSSSDDHSNTTINIHMGGYTQLEAIAEKILHGTSTNSAPSTNKEGRTMMDVIEALQTQLFSRDYMNDAAPRPSTETEEMSAIPEDIGKWFYSLSAIKQYTVQAVAILHGSKVQEIDQLRVELYEPIKTELERSQIQAQVTTVPVDTTTSYASTVEHLQSSDELYKETHTVFRIIHGVERVFWSDADEYGNSAFNLRVLSFCAREAIRGGWRARGPIFLAAAQRWIDTPKGDAFWRAARATGIIWRSQDIETLQRLANKWAQNTNQRGWRRGASLLYGAYEFEHSITIPEDSQKSCVTTILNQWVSNAHSYKNGQVGCAAAYTYGLIGRSYPEYALQGLDTLLDFPPKPEDINKNAGIPESVFVALVANYMGLVWSGHLRLLLQHISKLLEDFVHWRIKPEIKDFGRYRFRRTITLAMMFNIFFLITALSTADVLTTISLDTPLKNRPQIPDPDGRDVILVGTLNKGEDGWRSSVAKILCAAIIENKSRDVFLLFKQWTEQVLTQQESQQELQDNLIQLFIRLNNMLKRWENDLAQNGFTKYNARNIYQQHFIAWSKQHNRTGDFARHVLRYLEA